MKKEENIVKYAENGDIGGLKGCFDQGANLNSRDTRGITPLYAAVDANRIEAVQFLIDAGVNLNAYVGRANPLLWAGSENRPEVLELLIEADADPMLLDDYNGTALIRAADRGHLEVVKILCEKSTVDVNHINNLGWTALSEVVILGDGSTRRQQIVKILLNHGARDIPDKDGVFIYEHAKNKGQNEIAKLLKTAPR